jgi:hypothetical protein
LLKEKRLYVIIWIPACAGMTFQDSIKSVRLLIWIPAYAGMTFKFPIT